MHSGIRLKIYRVHSQQRPAVLFLFFPFYGVFRCMGADTRARCDLRGETALPPVAVYASLVLTQRDAAPCGPLSPPSGKVMCILSRVICARADEDQVKAI